MEVYSPILEEKGLKKIQRNSKNCKDTKYFLSSILRKKFNKNHEVFDQVTKKQKEPLDKRIIDAMNAQEVKTDESMNGIELDDIKSIDSDEYGITNEQR